MTPADREALAMFDQLPDGAIVRLPVVCVLFGGIAPSTVWRKVKAGKISAPVELGPMSTGWVVGRLRRDLAAIAAGASAGEAA